MEKTDLRTQLAEVAERIRTMREITGLSEGEMAKCTGVPLEEYQQCEAGEKDFSFTFIYKCAQRFGIDPTDLIKGVSPTLSSYTVNRKGDGLPITRRQGFKYLNMAPLFKNKTAEPFFVTMPYEEAQQKVAIKLSTHVGQELDIILKGAMKVQVGNHIEVLHEGDSIYYNSATPHGMIATEGAECQFYAIVMKGAEEFAPEQDRFQRLIDQKLARTGRLSPRLLSKLSWTKTASSNPSALRTRRSSTSPLTLWTSWRRSPRTSWPCSTSAGTRWSAASPLGTSAGGPRKPPTTWKAWAFSGAIG